VDRVTAGPSITGSPFVLLAGGLWTMPQCDLFPEVGSEQSPRRWPRSGIWARGLCFARATWVPRTAGTGSSSSLLLTPTAQLAVNGGSQAMAKRREGGHGPTLADQVEWDIPPWSHLPTPTSNVSGRTAEQHMAMRRAMDRNTPSQLEAAAQLLPTPGASDGKGNSASQSRERFGRPRPAGDVDLPEAVALLPTPRTTDRGSAEHPSPAQLRGTHGRDLAPTVGMLPSSLLPTPRSTDGDKGGPNMRGSSGDLMLPSAVGALLPTPAAADGDRSSATYPRGNPTLAGALLPTPTAGVHNDGEDLASWEARRARLLAKDYNGNGQGTPLAVAVMQMLPTPTAREWKGPGTGRPGRVRPDGRVRGAGDVTLGLAVAGMTLLPTPTVHDKQGPRDAAGVAARASTSGGPPSLLSETIVNKVLPTPQAHDAQGPKTPEQIRAMRAKGATTRGRQHGVSNLNETAAGLLPTPSAAIATGGQTSRSGDRIGEMLLTGIARDRAEGTLSGTATSPTNPPPPPSTGSNTVPPSTSGKPSPDDEQITLFDLAD
jgi:hypothetical protein